MWFKGRGRKDRPLTPVGALLVAETGAYLLGDFAEEARRRGNPVPAWSLLNVFAHGELSSIEELRSSPGESTAPELDDDERSWKSAQQVLADELVQLVGVDSDLLDRIQQKVLVPLEHSVGNDAVPMNEARSMLQLTI